MFCWKVTLCGARIKANAPEPVRSEKSLALVTPLCEECLDLNTERWRGAHGDASDATFARNEHSGGVSSSGGGSRNSRLAT